MDGFAIYDLMRFAGSFRLSPQMLREELAAHAAALGVPVEQTGTYLMAGLGHYARNLGQFPLPRFRAMAETCFRDCRRRWRATAHVGGYRRHPDALRSSDQSSFGVTAQRAVGSRATP